MDASRLVLSLTALLSTEPAWAAGFEIKLQDICPASHQIRSADSIRGKVLGLLEKSTGVADIDIDNSGQDIPYPKKVRALLDPEGFCRSTGTCEKGVKEKLGTANVILVSFLENHARPVSAGQPGYVISTREGQPATPRQFLLGGYNEVFLECKAVSTAAAGGRTKGASTAEGAVIAAGAPAEASTASHFAIRKNPEDIHFGQDSPKFKGLERASLSITDDYVKRSQTFSVDGVVGYSFDTFGLIDRVYSTISPFFSYDQNYSRSPNVKSNTSIFNIGGGVIGDVLFPVGNVYNDIQIFPKFVHSISTDADVFTGNITFTPEPAFPGIGTVYYIAPDLLSIQFIPQLKFAYYEVANKGTDAALLPAKSNFERVGPKLAVALYGEDWLDGFVYNASYEYYRLFDNPIQSFARFETSLNYLIGEKELAAIQVKYVDGRDLDTLQKQQKVTVGLGLKY